MPQRPKPEIREDIVRAATSLFAEVGWGATSIAAVAERAGVSTGNVYRYFASKEELLGAAVPDAFVDELRRLTRARIEALHAVRDIDSLAKGAPYRAIAGELMDLSIANRERIVFLLGGGAAGTVHARFVADFRQRLVGWALAYVEATWPEVPVGPRLRFALERIYAGFLASIADALREYRDPAAVREVVDHLSAHHQGGLRRLFEESARAARKEGSR